MTMQRRHFELIAEAIRELRIDNGASYNPSQPLADFVRSPLAYTFAAKLSATNPNFDRARFLRACGISDD